MVPRDRVIRDERRRALCRRKPRWRVPTHAHTPERLFPQVTAEYGIPLGPRAAEIVKDLEATLAEFALIGKSLGNQDDEGD